MASIPVSKLSESEIIFRDVDQSTASDCRNLINVSFMQHPDRSKLIDVSTYAKFSQDGFEKARANGRFRIAFLKSTNEMIGSFYVSAKMKEIDDVLRKVIYLDGVCVKAEFQKRGVSKILLYEVERVSREMEGYAIEANVMDFNDWEIVRLVNEASATIFERYQITKVEFPEFGDSPTEVSWLRKVIDY